MCKVYLHTDKSFRNFIKSIRNQIVSTIFELIRNSKQTLPAWIRINRKMVNTIWFQFDLIIFWRYFSVCTETFGVIPVDLCTLSVGHLAELSLNSPKVVLFTLVQIGKSNLLGPIKCFRCPSEEIEPLGTMLPKSRAQTQRNRAWILSIQTKFGLYLHLSDSFSAKTEIHLSLNQ